MPPLTDELTRRNVIRQWILGFPRDTIAEQNNIGAGTVSSIVSNYKVGLEELDFDSIRQLAVEARQHGWNFADLASHARLYNYFIKSGAAENKIELFITKVSSNDIPPERIIELVYQLHEISNTDSIPLDQVQNYIEKKLEEKKKIDEQIKEADATLQSKNVSIETIDEHIRLNQKLNEYNLSFEDIDKLLNVLVNAKENEFDGKKIVEKLKKIKGLQSKEEKLKKHCGVLSEQVKKCNNVLPLAQKMVALNIDIKQLLIFESTVNQLAKQYNLPPYVAAWRLFNEIKEYNKIGGLKKEVSRLSQQKTGYYS
jgi:vacuolar-type H+-ATPase subunit I/STV1